MTPTTHHYRTTQQRSRPQRNNKMEALTTRVGQFGCYQKMAYFLVCIPSAISGMLVLGVVFTAFVPSHRCNVPALDKNNVSGYEANGANLSTFLYSAKPVDGKSSASYCRYCPNATTGDPSCTLEKSIACDRGYVYDMRQIQTSLTIEFNMVCSNSWMLALLKSMNMVGFLLGAAAVGVLSDRFGRRPAALFCSVILIVFANVIPFVHEFSMLCVLQATMTFFSHGALLCCFTMVMELIGGLPATLCGIFFQAPFSLGVAYVGLVSYFIKDWQLLHWSFSLWTVVQLAAILFLDESLRWLLHHNKHNKAVVIIRKVIRRNKVQAKENEIVDQLEHEPESKHVHFSQMFRYPILARNTLIIFFNWCASAITYYGLSFNTGELPMNPHLSLAISGLIELPGFCIAAYSMHRFGRRLTMSCLIGLSGACLVSVAFIPPNTPASVTSTVAMLGKLGSAAAFAAIYVYTAELFPTVVRNTGLGASSSVARVAAILAPQIQLLEAVRPWLPNLIYGIVALMAAVLNLLLPETLHAVMPESVEDALKAARKRQPSRVTAPIQLRKMENSNEPHAEINDANVS